MTMPDRIWAWQNYRRFWTPFKYPLFPNHEEYTRTSWLKEQIEKMAASVLNVRACEGEAFAYQEVLRLLSPQEGE